jgi:hypothetical protein
MLLIVVRELEPETEPVLLTQRGNKPGSWKSTVSPLSATPSMLPEALPGTTLSALTNRASVGS